MDKLNNEVLTQKNTLTTEEKIAMIMPKEKRANFDMMERAHLKPETASGSLFYGFDGIEELLEEVIEKRGSLDGDDRQKFLNSGVPEDVMLEKCRYLMIDIKGEMGMVNIKDLGDDVVIKVGQAKKDTGDICPLSVTLDRFEEVNYGTIIIGPNTGVDGGKPSTKEAIWTLHPGAPIGRSKKEYFEEGQKLTKKEVIEKLGNNIYIRIDR